MVQSWDFFVGHAQKAELFKAGSSGSLVVASYDCSKSLEKF